jgi:hypothetical protein
VVMREDGKPPVDHPPKGNLGLVPFQLRISTRSEKKD